MPSSWLATGAANSNWWWASLAPANQGFIAICIVHSASGSKVEPVSLNQMGAAHYSPAELEWVDSLARSLV